MSKTSKEQSTVEEILVFVGGAQNISDVYHCATRMRLTLVDQTSANLEALKKIPIIKGALYANGELQLIIGQEVSKITTALKEALKNQSVSAETINFAIKPTTVTYNLSIGKRLLKSVSAIFGPLIPFLIGVGLIMAIQQLLFRVGAIAIPGNDSVLGVDYNLFDYILNVVASTGFKMMGVIAMWSTVRYLGGKTPTALAVALIMISPVLIADGVQMFKIGSWEINVGPYYSRMLVFIVMGVIIAYGQKTMEKFLHPIANFILNPLVIILVGGLLAFFIMGPIMGVIENAMLVAFNWFMTIPFGIGTMIVGLTWQPLVVLGVHNILFFAAVTAINAGESSLFLAAAFAAAWAQMGATIAVALKSKKNIDKYAAVAAAVPGIISGPTESCIYAVNLPNKKPFITGVIAGAIGGWLIGIFNVSLDNLAGLGGIVGFLAYTDDLLAAVLIDLASFGLGIGITYLLWSEFLSEKTLAQKTLKLFAKSQYLNSTNDFAANEASHLIKKIVRNNKNFDKVEALSRLEKLSIQIGQVDQEDMRAVQELLTALKGESKVEISGVINRLKTVQSQRQVEVKALYLELNNNIKELKKLTPNSKAWSKLVAKNDNVKFSIERIKKIETEKKLKLIQHGEKLIETNNSVKVARGKESVLIATNYTYKADKVEELGKKLIALESLIEEKQKALTTEIKTFYKEIDNKVEKISALKNQDLTDYSKQFYNDLHSQSINANKAVKLV